jgi:hypothetical protein
MSIAVSNVRLPCARCPAIESLLKLAGWVVSSNAFSRLKWKSPKHFGGVVPIVPKNLDSRLPLFIDLRIDA